MNLSSASNIDSSPQDPTAIDFEPSSPKEAMEEGGKVGRGLRREDGHTFDKTLTDLRSVTGSGDKISSQGAQVMESELKSPSWRAQVEELVQYLKTKSSNL
nr:hypothetical protein Iba_chr14bCG6850 [Ipomoea batatas]